MSINVPVINTTDLVGTLVGLAHDVAAHKLDQTVRVTHQMIQDILKTLPIGYYLGDRVPVVYEERGSSYMDLMTGTIHVSGQTVMEALANLHDDDPLVVENTTRGVLYHELSHVILTPKLPMTNWLNIFEDERIETILSKYYLGVNFKKLVFAVNGWTKDWKPTDAESYFYGIVRYRQGPEQFVTKAARLINAWRHVNGASGQSTAYDYRSAVYDFWREVERDWDQNSNQRKDEQQQRNDQRNQQQVGQGGNDNQDQQEQGQNNASQDGSDQSDRQQGQGQADGDDSNKGQDQDKQQNGNGGSRGDDNQDGQNESTQKKGGSDEQGEAGDDSNEKGENSRGDGEQQDTADESAKSKGRGRGKGQEQKGSTENGSANSSSGNGDSADGADDGEKGEDETGAGDGDPAEEEAERRQAIENAKATQDITREAIAKVIESMINSMHDEKVGRVLERLIIRHNKKYGCRTPESLGYTGKINIKSLATRQDYRWFSRKGGDGENKFGATHITLWVDCSGSFSSDITAVNRMIHELNQLARRLGREFSFDVVKMTMKNEVVPTTTQLTTGGCNGFGPGVEDCVRKTRKSGYRNYDVVVWDGDMFSGFGNSTRDKWIPTLVKAFNNANTVLVTDRENETIVRRHCPKARSRIISSNYADNFITALLELLGHVLV